MNTTIMGNPWAEGINFHHDQLGGPALNPHDKAHFQILAVAQRLRNLAASNAPLVSYVEAMFEVHADEQALIQSFQGGSLSAAEMADHLTEFRALMNELLPASLQFPVEPEE